MLDRPGGRWRATHTPMLDRPGGHLRVRDRVSGAALGFAAGAAWCLRYFKVAPDRRLTPDAVAKTVAELTSQQDGFIRQQVIEQLMREIMNYDAEFRSEEATFAVGSQAKH